ncbi:Glycerophosphocholine phosphodiesterase [Chamberlinius hualienensis]
MAYQNYGKYKMKQPPFIAAHRTLALECPENSLSGIRKAKQTGFNVVEFDVRFSQEGVPILFHDEFIDRVTNESGKVDQLPLAHLKSLDISERHLLHKNFENEKIPTLKEAIEECLSLNLIMIIDVKSPNIKMVTALSEFYKIHEDLHNKSMVVSVSPSFLYRFKKRNPMVTTGLVWRPQMLSLNCPTGNLDHASLRFSEKWKQLLAVVADPAIDWTYNNILWYLCGADAFLCHRDVVNRQYARMWKRRNVPILVWPVNNPIEKLYFSTVLDIGYLTDTHLPLHEIM